jgi:hypothetical protein
MAVVEHMDLETISESGNGQSDPYQPVRLELEVIDREVALHLNRRAQGPKETLMRFLRCGLASLRSAKLVGC